MVSINVTDFVIHLSPSERLALYDMTVISALEGNFSWSMSQFSSYTGIPRTTLERTMENLERMGFIKREENSNKTSRGRKQKLITIVKTAF